MSANADLLSIKGVGPALAELLQRVGIESVYDLIYYFPRRYDDYSHIFQISEIEPGPISIKVEVGSVSSRYAKRGLHITEAVVSDGTDNLRVTWFNQRYRADSLKEDTEYYMSGEYQFSAGRFL